MSNYYSLQSSQPGKSGFFFLHQRSTFWHHESCQAGRKISLSISLIAPCAVPSMCGVRSSMALPSSSGGQPRPMTMVCIILGTFESSLTNNSQEGYPTCMTGLSVCYLNALWRSISPLYKVTPTKLFNMSIHAYKIIDFNMSFADILSISYPLTCPYLNNILLSPPPPINTSTFPFLRFMSNLHPKVSAEVLPHLPWSLFSFLASKLKTQTWRYKVRIHM